MFLKKKIEKALGMQVLVSDEMSAKIGLWRDLYQGKAPWITDSVKSMNLCSLIASEFARLSMLEFKAEFEENVRGSLFKKAFDSFTHDAKRYVEYACALGGAVFKPYIQDGRILTDYVSGDRFFPTKTGEGGKVISAAFCEFKRVSDTLYLRIEHHEMTDFGIEITNRAFCLGGLVSFSEVPLSRVDEWKDLDEYTFIKGAKSPLFAYFKIPFANTIDLNSPLGASVYSKACDVICEADKQYSRLLWEFEGGELAIDASVDALKFSGKDFSMPKLSDRLFRGLDIEKDGGDLYSVFAPALRDESIINGLEQLLKKTEDLCGLSRGILSSADLSAKTATELKMMKQKTYSSVCDIQKALEFSFRDLIAAFCVLCDVYSLAPSEKCNVSFEFDDSVMADRVTEFEERKALLAEGVIAPWEMRMWYLGESKEVAQKMETLMQNAKLVDKKGE